MRLLADVPRYTRGQKDLEKVTFRLPPSLLADIRARSKGSESAVVAALLRYAVDELDRKQATVIRD